LISDLLHENDFDDEGERELEQGIILFNEKPKKGIEYLIN